MEKKIIALLLWIWLGLLCDSVLAAGRVFKIEMIVFAHDQASSEVFDQTRSEIEWPQRIAALNSFNQVAPEHRSLHGIYARLQQSAGYRPLLHLAWTQSVASDALGRAVQIQNGPVNGFFRLQRGHVLHLLADLEYSPSGHILYRINEKRRFKFNEIHYLDHPKFGVVIRVSPVS